MRKDKIYINDKDIKDIIAHLKRIRTITDKIGYYNFDIVLKNGYCNGLREFNLILIIDKENLIQKRLNNSIYLYSYI